MNLSGFCRKLPVQVVQGRGRRAPDRRQPRRRPRKWFTACRTPSGKPNTSKKPAPSSKPRLAKKERPLMTDLNTLRASLKTGEHAFAQTLAFIAAEPRLPAPGLQQRRRGKRRRAEPEGSCVRPSGLACAGRPELDEETPAGVFGEHYRCRAGHPGGGQRPRQYPCALIDPWPGGGRSLGTTAADSPLIAFLCRARLAGDGALEIAIAVASRAPTGSSNTSRLSRLTRNFYFVCPLPLLTA